MSFRAALVLTLLEGSALAELVADVRPAGQSRTVVFNIDQKATDQAMT